MRTFATVVGCLLVFCSAFSSAAETWSGTIADQMISYDDTEASRAVQTIYNTWTETLHALWGEDAPFVREIHYGRSTDRGLTWTCSWSDRVISFPDGNDVSPEECAVALDPRHEVPTLIVVWSEDVVDTQEIHYGISYDEGLTWSSELIDQILSNPGSAVYAGTPSVAIDSNGIMHVVWHQLAEGGEEAEVHYSRSTDGGATWSGALADRFISFPDGNAAIDPKIVVGEDDRLFIVWKEDGDSGNKTIHLGISDDGGTTWSSEVADREISPPGTLMTKFALSATVYESDGVHVVYALSHNTQSPYYYELYSTSSYDSGMTWTGESGLVPVSHDEGEGRSASNPDVFVGPSQGAIAVWNEKYDGTDKSEQHISRLSGATWSGADGDEIISFPDGENGYRPSITGSLDTFVVPPRDDDPHDTFVAWTEYPNDGPYYEVHFSAARLIVNQAPEWEPPLQLDLRVSPNPSSRSTRIEWVSPTSGVVEIMILDAAGRKIRSFDGSNLPGSQSLLWDHTDRLGCRLPAGLYFARIRTGAGVRTAPLVVM